MKEQLQKAFEFRQTVKKYSDKHIETDKWETIKDAIYWAPTSHGFEPYRVLIINRENPLRQELKPAMWGQGVVDNADKLVFFISVKREIFTNEEWLLKRALRRAENVAGLQGGEALAAAKKHADTVLNVHLKNEEPNGDDWAMKQSYIALGMAMETAALLGVNSTPMEGFDRAKVKAIFKAHNLINDFEEVALVGAFGYPFDNTSYAHWGNNKRVRDPREVKFKEI